jgi:hypothetical protein
MDQNHKIAKLGQIPKDNVFRVPIGYFDQMSFESLQIRIENQDITEKKHDVFTIPSGYFDTLEQSIQGRVFVEEFSQVDSSLSVPEGYFEELSDKIFEKIDAPQATKTMLLYQNNVFKYAVAALMLLAIGFGLVLRNQTESNVALNQNDKAQPSFDLAQTLIDNLHKDDVKHYLLQQENIDGHELLANTSSTKKQKILTTLQGNILPTKLKKQEKQDLELELEHLDISDLDTDI